MKENIITISSEIQSGAPVFTGTRVPVKNLFDYIKGGNTIDEFLLHFPSVKRAQVEFLKGMRKTITVEELKKEQNYQGIDREEFDRLVAELDIQEPIDELLAMLD